MHNAKPFASSIGRFWKNSLGKIKTATECEFTLPMAVFPCNAFRFVLVLHAAVYPTEDGKVRQHFPTVIVLLIPQC